MREDLDPAEEQEQKPPRLTITVENAGYLFFGILFLTMAIVLAVVLWAALSMGAQ